MVAALTLLLAATAAPAPVAAFSAPATVRVGQNVTYVDHSYDPAPGHHITLRIWIGRQSSFSSPGSYSVTLVVEDDRGLMSSVSHTITAVRVAPPPQNPSTLSLSSTTVRRGDAFEVTLQNASGVQNIHLVLPPSFLETVQLPTGSIDYAQVNQGDFAAAGGALTSTVWVPWTVSSPADGSYSLSVTWTEGGVQHSLAAAVTVAGTDQLAVWAQN